MTLSSPIQVIALALTTILGCGGTTSVGGVEKESSAAKKPSNEAEPGSETDEPSNEDCDVPSICQLCDDGVTCAVPEVEVSDGECGEINWVCPEESSDDERTDPDASSHGQDASSEDCDVPSICQLCDDGETCAVPEGECGEINWVCPEE